ncbi:MAG: hypothetical protein ACPGJV_11170 [Bacteriovoracaceae bacterium]
MTYIVMRTKKSKILKSTFAISIAINAALIVFLFQISNPVSLKTAINFSKVNYINACVTASKELSPERSWRSHCLNKGNQFFSDIEQIFR